ncbi:MAG: FtsX-like permease family protein [Lachnospiraceae bacterium]|nr:FtsX-like permease family protein [Lachnospiraceae bacterium]
MHNMQKITTKALICLTRKRKKTIILTTVFLVLSVTMLSGILIYHSIENALKELREQFYGCINVNAVGDENFPLTPNLASLAAEKIGADGFTGVTICYLSVENISLIPGRFTSSGEPAMYLTRLNSCRDSSLARDFTTDALSLSQGRHLAFDDKGKALISENLAEMNGLELGDRITCVVTDDLVTNAKTGLGGKYEFEIAGIYQVKQKQGSSDSRAECDILDNALYIDESTGFQIEKKIWNQSPYYANGLTLWLKDPEKLEHAMQILKDTPEFAPQYYHMESNRAEYDHSSQPMHQTEQILFIFLAAISGIGAVFLIAILSMWNYERMPEIGVLLSLGLKKKIIVLQLLLENSILFLTGFLMAVPLTLLCSLLIGNLGSIEHIALSLGDIFIAGIAVWILCGFSALLSLIRIMKKSPSEIVTTIM